MARSGNPNPSPATRFKPGNPGGPGGYSNKRRFTDGLLKLIDEKGADPAILAMWLRAILQGDFRYFQAMLERVEGKVADKLITEEQKVVVERRDRKRKSTKGRSRKPPRDAGASEG